MADLPTKSFDTLVSEQAAAVQGSSSALVDFTVGSILRAIVQAYAAVAMWLQGLVLQVLALTRASTSTGTDLDTWQADFGFVRLGAAAASGLLTFARFTNTAQAVVPIGAIAQVANGAQTYAVALDITNAAYNADLRGYVLAPGVSALSVPATAVTSGAAGNAAAGAINTLGQAIAGIDTVTNAAAFTNGSDAESDPAARARFVEFVASLSKATKGAVDYAVDSVKTGLIHKIVENEDYSGAAHMGYFYVVVDDGSGAPSSDLLNQVYGAIDATRPLCSGFGVFAPTLVTINVVVDVSLAAGFDPTMTEGIVRAAIIAYLNGLNLGQSLSYTRLIQVAYDASAGVTNVSGLTVNGSTSDIAATAKQVLRAGTVAVA